jgi:hypothetical protein
MAFDSATNQLILFSGIGNSGLINDTWSWDGTNWIQLFPATSPLAREAAVMAFDSATNRLILFGGFDGIGNSGYLNDTWSWNGSTWTQLFPATSPPERVFSSLAFDTSAGQLILFGGTGISDAPLNDTWSWNGTNWIQLSPATSPPASEAAVMAFDSVTNQLILFGGISNTGYLDDT